MIFRGFLCTRLLALQGTWYAIDCTLSQIIAANPLTKLVSHANNAESDILTIGGSGRECKDSNKRKSTAIAFVTTAAAA